MSGFHASVSQSLDCHQRRRAQAIPTVSVLCGPPGASMALWLEWAGARNLAVVEVRAVDEAAVVRAWLEALATRRNLAEDATAFLARHAGVPPDRFGRGVPRQTRYERDVVLGTSVLPNTSAAFDACRVLLERPGELPGADVLLRACGPGPIGALAALHALLPEGAAPALFLLGVDAAWLWGAARLASRLCAAVPQCVIALAAERDVLDAVLRKEESQTLAMLREGLIALEPSSPPAVALRLKTLGVAGLEPLAPSVARLVEDGATDALLSTFGDAARALADGPRARSAAEAFLFQRLESLPWSRGLFELNASLPSLQPSARPLEVDFLARELRIAVEIDGFFHFREPDAYRSDRRKDLELQRQGYLVLRFLADDVVARLEDILNTLKDAVSLRSANAGQTGGEV